MKLFSLKKNNDSTAPTSKDANPSSQLAENPMIGVSDNPLQLDTIQAPMQATKSPDTSPNTSPETTAIKNAFSLDSIDLNQLEDELLHGKMDYTADNTKAADTLAPKKLSFDDFDLDELPSDVEPNTTVTIEDTANTATVSQPVPSQTTDNALIFDIDNLPLAAKPDPDLNLSLESDPHSAQAQRIAPQSSDENSDESNDKKTIEAIETIETTPPVVLTKTKPESKAVIDQTANPFLRPLSQPLAKRTLKKRNQLGLLVGAGSALAALAWFFMGQSSEPNKSTAQTQTQTQAHATPKTAAPIVKPQASASLPVVADANSSSAHETAALPAITPEEILTPTLPEDPAIAKEELSRLSEQSAQLKEQETMMQDQLRMMNELSSKKEERIQLLEQQVAQLEQQKAANK